MQITRDFRRLAAVLAGALTLASASQAAADVIFTTGPSSGQINAKVIRTVSQSQVFTLASASMLTGVQFGVWTTEGVPLTVVNWAVLDDRQSAGGHVLYSGSTIALSQSGAVETVVPPVLLHDVTFATPASFLAAGTYWLQLSVDDAFHNGPDYWDINAAPAPGVGEVYASGKFFPVDERAAFTLYGTLRAGLSGAPEPATWAMMLGGLALAGGALRLRRASAA